MRHHLFHLAICTSLASFVHAQTAILPSNPEEKLPPPKTADEIQLRYLSVLAALKKPAATGLLVAELGSYSNAANAGVRPGDIIVEYLGRRLDDLTDKDRNKLLRDLVTRAIDEQKKKDINPLATFIVLRDKKLVVLAAERMPLGIFTIPVEKNVAMPLNPVESDRGSFTTTWAASSTILRIGESREGIENAGAASFENHQLAVSAPNASLTLTARALVKLGVPAQTIFAAKLNLTVTDRTISPALALEDFSYADETIEVAATRKGGVIRGTINRKLAHIIDKGEHPTLAEAIPTLALPHFAASLPQEPNIVIHFSTLNEIDLQTRLGYALETRGKVKIKIEPEIKTETKTGEGIRKKEKEIEAFAVRLWHFGQLESTFYFNEERQLLSATSEIGGPSMARSENETEALKSLVIIKDPSTTRSFDPSIAPPLDPAATRAISPDAGEKK